MCKLLLISTILWTFSGIKAQRVDFVPFTSMEGLFRVEVPGEMSYKSDTITTDLGDLVYHTYFYQHEEAGAENFIYMVSYVDYPANTVHSDSTTLLPDFFEVTIDQAAFSINGELIYKNEIQEEGYPGYLWRINYQQGEGVIKTKAIVRENRYYNIQAVTIRPLALNPTIDLFLDSFKLL
ncbi:MAG: hypothetical protein AAF242_03965 [Bacteroidota bacterium]